MRTNIDAQSLNVFLTRELTVITTTGDEHFPGQNPDPQQEFGEVAMNESEKNVQTAEHEVTETPTPAPDVDRQRKLDRQEARRWWIKLFLQPALLLVCGAILIVGLGVAQRYGFVSAGGGGQQSAAPSAGADVQYICPDDVHSTSNGTGALSGVRDGACAGHFGWRQRRLSLDSHRPGGSSCSKHPYRGRAVDADEAYDPSHR